MSSLQSWRRLAPSSGMGGAQPYARHWILPVAAVDLCVGAATSARGASGMSGCKFWWDHALTVALAALAALVLRG